MSEPRLSIPRVGSSNLSERAIWSAPKSLDIIGEKRGNPVAGQHPLAVNGSGSKRTQHHVSGRKVPDKIPDDSPKLLTYQPEA